MPRLKLQRLRSAVCAAAAAILLAACGSGETDPGTVRFALTDAPACGFDQVNLSIERIRVNRNADASENSLGWTDLKLAPARRIDLLKLGNGVLEELGELQLPAGRYAQLRLVLAAKGETTPANSVLPTGGEETVLDIASIEAGGIRVVHAFSVEQDKVTDVLFDFDLRRLVAAHRASGAPATLVLGLANDTQGYAPDRTAAGVISGAGGVATGMTMGHSGTVADGQHHPVRGDSHELGRLEIGHHQHLAADQLLGLVGMPDSRHHLTFLSDIHD